MNTYSHKDVLNLQSSINLLFPCAQGRLDALPKRLAQESSTHMFDCNWSEEKSWKSVLFDVTVEIHLEEITVYETVPSESLDEELKEYFQNHGVRNCDVS